MNEFMSHTLLVPILASLKHLVLMPLLLMIIRMPSFNPTTSAPEVSGLCKQVSHGYDYCGTDYMLYGRIVVHQRKHENCVLEIGVKERSLQSCRMGSVLQFKGFDVEISLGIPRLCKEICKM